MPASCIQGRPQVVGQGPLEEEQRMQREAALRGGDRGCSYPSTSLGPPAAPMRPGWGGTGTSGRQVVGKGTCIVEQSHFHSSPGHW